MKVINVKASKNYDITVTSGFEGLEKLNPAFLVADKIAIITDDVVDALYLGSVSSLISKPICKFVIKAGEESKNVENYVKLINSLAENGFTRKSLVVAVGGGVVGDLAGFVASTYMRGIKFINIPTTLLAMVDSSIGGKTGVDLKYGKNLLGAFYQPDAVYINLDVLTTLPEREILSGFGEIMKYAFIDSRITVGDVDKKDLESLIIKSLEIKRDIVEKDERESGERMLLNFGHTVGHAIEKLSGYTLSHGECVIKGAYASVKASKKLGLIDSYKASEMINFLKFSGISEDYGYDKKELANAIQLDKKSEGDKVNFILVSDFATPVIKKIEISEIENLI